MRPLHATVVGIQILSAAVVVLGGSLDWNTWRFYLGVVCLAGFVFLTTWAVLSMRSSKLRIGPAPDRDAVLVRSGPYRYIRHPMYSSVLLLALGFLLAGFNIIRLIAMTILTVDLAVKIRLEEADLRRQFDDYDEYERRVKRFIPGVF